MKSLVKLILVCIITFNQSCVSTGNSNIKNLKDSVIILHGFGRSTQAMWNLESELTNAGYKVHSIGYSSLNQDIKGIKQEVYEKIDNACSKSNGSIHFVGHSLGGLLIRAYLGERKVYGLGNVVIMGSPSKGTPAVEYFERYWISQFAGPALKSLRAEGSEFLSSLKKPNYPLGVIAGTEERPNHEHILSGPDDGLVTVESTKVDGMKDFVTIKTNHMMMRYNKTVVKQTIYFLKYGVFLHKQK